MGARNLGRKALVIQGSREAQAVSNSITQRQVYNDPDDCCTLIAQSRVGMLVNKYNMLTSKYNLSFFSDDPPIAPKQYLDPY